MRMSDKEFRNLSKAKSIKSKELYREGHAEDIMRALVETRKYLIDSDIKKNPQDGSEKERLRLLVKKSRLLYGVCDQVQGLQYGQCQVRIATEGGLVVSLKGKAVVARSPAYLLGDVRVLEMVHVPGLEHLVDCVVFPTTGPRETVPAST